MYWLGNIYYNIGNYDECYRLWKLYYDNIDKAFDVTNKKIERITTFLETFQNLGKLLNMFKINLNNAKNYPVQSDDTKVCLNESEEVKDFLCDLQFIKKVSPNLRDNYTINYTYYKGLIHFYVESNSI